MGKGKKKGGNKGGPSSKTVQKEKQRIIEDKTFGLKNKNKSKKVQQYVKQVKTQTNQKMAKYEKKKNPNRSKKKNDPARDAQLAQLFKVAVDIPKVPPGTDLKTVLCPYFKAGMCVKGAKCKYSHDRNIERKAAKLDVYKDRREEQKEEETNENWTEEQLREVVNKKGQGQQIRSNKTCKFFLDAVRSKKYGWFWECPNGNKCHYRHALPEGFVLETKKVKEEEKEARDLCEILEEERQKLTGKGTPMTHELFKEWKKKKKLRMRKEAARKAKRRKQEIAAGKAVMSGRELLTYKPELFGDNDDDGGDVFDVTSLRAELLKEEEAEETTKTMVFDESLFGDDDDEDLDDLDLSTTEEEDEEGDAKKKDATDKANNNNNNNEEEGGGGADKDDKKAPAAASAGETKAGASDEKNAKDAADDQKKGAE